MDRRNGVEPRDHPLHVGQGRDRDARRDVGAEVRPRAHAEPDDPAAHVERQLARQDVVARLHVADEPFGSARHPLHRTPEMARRPGQRHVFGIHLDLGAEAAPDVAGDAPYALGRHTEDAREIGRELMHALKPGVERVTAGVGVPFGQRGARLQKARDEPIVDERQPRHVGGGGDGALRGLGVAALPVVREIARRGRVHRGRALGERRHRVDDRAPRPRIATRRPRRRPAPPRRSRRRPSRRARRRGARGRPPAAATSGSANGVPSRLRMPPPRSAIKVGIAPTPSATRSRPVNTPSTPATARAAVGSTATTSA